MITKQNRRRRLHTLLSFFALLVLAACGTNTSEQNPEARKTAFSVYVLATGNSTLQATPWTLERGATTIQGQGKALEVEGSAIGQRAQVMDVNAQPGDELTL